MERGDMAGLETGGHLRERLDGASIRPRGWLLASDVEGPMFLGDFIAEALAACLKPAEGAVDATPSYGQIIYAEGYAAFSADNGALRRPEGKRGGKTPPAGGYTLAQEGSDTIFALPLLLAAGVDHLYLERLALRSQQTPGAAEMARRLDEMGWQRAGITTAPQQPYRAVAERCGWLAAERLLGSPFPLAEAEALLRRLGRWEMEIGWVRTYLRDAYELIDRHSEAWLDGSIRRRHFSDTGRKLLRQRFRLLYRGELGISYSRGERAGRSAASALGRVIEACAMVGDRAKAALALGLARRAGGLDRLVTMGDGANDAAMLRRARWSIGVNGPDAARAAAIGLVTDDMRHALVLLRLIERGGDVGEVVGRAQAELRDAALVHRGGDGLSAELAEKHRLMKRRLRGEFVTY
ncbi:hypothetical protein [Chromobacterium violaceum]|uniref:hypothetical protein n=1 Tax=Chromobacterium violaceum TaxID=536 RepID=UPI001C8C9945|nr:hypothetical protein [Chromobacterium violaceum]MBX9265616.1 hypothetical protein [Chromobacterium violaceum]MCD0493108.1 hypothetical protein [Chromobacterium violaceum]